MKTINYPLPCSGHLYESVLWNHLKSYAGWWTRLQKFESSFCFLLRTITKVRRVIFSWLSHKKAKLPPTSRTVPPRNTKKRARVHTHAPTHARTHTGTLEHTHTDTLAHSYTRTQAHRYTRTHTHTRTHVHVRTHAHMHSWRCSLGLSSKRV